MSRAPVLTLPRARGGVGPAHRIGEVRAMRFWQSLVIAAVLTSLAMACTPAPSPGTTSVQPDRVSGPKRVAAAMNGNAYSVYAKLVSGAGGLAAGGQISG